MNNGELQRVALGDMRNYLLLINKFEQIENQGRCEFIQEYLSEFLIYSKGFCQFAQLFGVEDYYEKTDCWHQFWERVNGDAGNIQANIEEVEHVIDSMKNMAEYILSTTQGRRKVCTCCGNEVYYWPLSSYHKKQTEEAGAEWHTAEFLNEEEYTCPCCASSDRDRLIIEFLKKLQLDQGYYKESMLQIAPAKSIEHWIHGNCYPLRYDTLDLYMEDVTFSLDIQDMHQIEDESYDYIICSHVLEHVQDDRKAMRELKRILRTDGFCIFLVPIVLGVDEIDEEWGLSEKENWKRFGQGDHCRAYTRAGLTDRLEEEGFYVHALGKEYFGDEIFFQNAITDTANLYILTKRDGCISELMAEKLLKRKNHKMENPLVTVVMSAYNHEKYVGEAIESVLSQTYSNIQFLAADDASTDGTVDELVKYEDQIDQIHLYGENTRAFLPWKAFAENAKGKYVALINSDDVWKKEKIECQVAYMENHPECAACFTGADYVDDNGAVKDFHIFLMDNKSRKQWMRHFFCSGNCLAHPSILIKREIYFDLMKDAWAFRQLPDFYMWLKLVQKYDLHVIENNLMIFRFHDQGSNKNVSAHTVENDIRTVSETAYIWYRIIKNMDNRFFVEVFKGRMLDKDAFEEIDILCEKFYILYYFNDNIYCKQMAMFFLYDIMQTEGVCERLLMKYGFKFDDIFEISGSIFIKKIETRG